MPSMLEFFFIYIKTNNIGEKIMAYMSEEGYNKLLADLKQLETVERPKIVAAIAEATTANAQRLFHLL